MTAPPQISDILGIIPKPGPPMLRARKTFTCDYDGEQVVINEGERVTVGHPVIRGREHLFERPGEARATRDYLTPTETEPSWKL